MTKLVQHAAAACVAVLIVTATFVPVLAVPQASAASVVALPAVS